MKINILSIDLIETMQESNTLTMTSISTCSEQPSASHKKVLIMRVWANPIQDYTTDLILLDQHPVLKTQRVIEENSTILLDHQTSKVKVMPLLERRQRRHMRELCQGYLVLAQVRLDTNHRGNLCFSLKADNQPRKDIFCNTFVNVHPTRDIRAIYLNQKDLVKMGKEIYQVRFEQEVWGKYLSQEDSPDGVCRICLSRQNSKSEDEWLVSPCLCTGSCSSVHFSCLQKWVKYKAILHESHQSISYNVEALYCQICKAPYPQKIIHNGQVEQIVPGVHFGKCEQRHVSFKHLNNSNSTIYHTVCMERDPVQIGRSGSNDLIMDELSISRRHASLHMEKGRVTLTDCGSKFGTFSTLRELKGCESVRLMSGRWTFGFSIE